MDKTMQKKCICPMCPTYVNCGEPLAFCLPEIELSRCIRTEAGCVCPGCPVYEHMGFDSDYYCIRRSI